MKTAQRVLGGISRGFGDITGKVLWFKADALALNDGDAVGTWTDSSGNGYDVTQGTTANKPTYKTGILNSLPVVRFDGVNDYLTRAYNAAYNTTDFTVFAVVAPRGGAGTYRAIAASAHAAGANTGWTIYLSGGNTYQIFAGAGGASYIASGTGAVSVGTAYVVSTVRSTGSTADFLSGAAAGTDSSGYTANNATGFIIGSDNAAAQTFFMNGDVAELIVYGNALTSSDRAIVTAALGAKYGITVS